MREFFDELIECTIILNSQRQIIFVNKEFYRLSGYNANELQAKEFIKIDNNNVIVKCSNNNIINGTCEFKEIIYESEKCYLAVVRFEEDKISLLNNLQSFMDSMEERVTIRNLNKDHTFVNDTFSKTYNLSNEETKERLRWEITEGPYKDIMSKNDEYVAKTKNHCLYEEVIDVNGIKYYYEVNKYPILNDKGEVKNIGVLIRDIGFGKNIQLKVFECLNLFNNKLSSNEDIKIQIENYERYLFEGLKDIFGVYFQTEKFDIWVYNRESKIIKKYFTNKLYNKSSELEKYLSDEEVKKYIEDKFEKITYNAGEKINNDTQNSHCIIKYPILHDDEFMGLITVRYDNYPNARVSENVAINVACQQMGFIIKYIKIVKELEKTLINKEKMKEELEAFLNVATDFVLKIDDNGKFADVSGGCMDILGWSKEEMVNMSFYSIVHEDDLKATKEFIRGFKDTEDGSKRLSFKNRFRCKSDKYKWIRWEKGFYKNHEGYILASGKDITKYIEISNKNKALEKAKHLDKVKGEFFANLSHELKTPITLILSVVQILQHQQLISNDNKNKVDRYIEILKQNSYRLLRLINNMIDVTKLDAGFYKIRPVNVNIIEVVEDIVLSVAEYCDNNKIELVFNTETEEEILSCDPEQIERIILNLLSNAIKYTDPNGLIYVNIDLDENHVIITVKDTGVGISSEKLEFIFERFIQDDNLLTRRCEGSGIGLSLVKSLVELHNGRVSAQSEQGSGSTFEVRLPRVILEDEIVHDIVKTESKNSDLERYKVEFSDIYN